jgi:hypothetical protein
MKLRLLAVFVLLALAAVSPIRASIVMPLDGTWVKWSEFMTAPAFFSESWTWTSASSVLFTITDWAVVSDQFEVYDNGNLVLTTPSKPDWDQLRVADPFVSPPYQPDDIDAAFNSGYFSSGTILFAPGSHSITIRDIHIPPVSVGGGPFADGTVAFKAQLVAAPVPEPASLTLAGLASLLVIGYHHWFGKRG